MRRKPMTRQQEKGEYEGKGPEVKTRQQKMRVEGKEAEVKTKRGSRHISNICPLPMSAKHPSLGFHVWIY